jgi:predicted aldo/keto reductase-like oxidoreductase
MHGGSKDKKGRQLSRRNFIKATTAGTLGLPLAGLHTWTRESSADAGGEPQIREFRPLGDTGWNVSDISFGAGSIANVGVLQYALDCGVNYIDTAEGYRQGKSEEVVGEAVKGRRDKVCIVTKYELRPDGTKDSYRERLSESLKRMQTDYVDVVMPHGVTRPEELENEEFLSAMVQAKKEGKVRFLGYSSHDPNMEKLFEHSLTQEEYKVALVVYNFIRKPENQDMFARARKKGVGIVAMKTLAGAEDVELEGVKEGKISFPHAAFKWVMANPHISCLIATIATYDQIEEYLPASGKNYGRMDERILEEYAQKVYGKYCGTCGNCLKVCPGSVAVPTIMRYGMYFENYGREKRAMEDYAGLSEDQKPSSCALCSAPCESVCSQRIPIKRRLEELDSTLNLSGGLA